MSSFSFDLQPDPERFLISAKQRETENSNAITPAFAAHLDDYFSGLNVPASESRSFNSVFFDTPEFDIARRLRDLRDRLKSDENETTRYPDEFAFKAPDAEFTACALEVARRRFSADEMVAYTPFMPSVRQEIQKRHGHLRNFTEYRHSDLPREIGDPLLEIDKGIDRKAIRPQFAVMTTRRKYGVLLNPNPEAKFITPFSLHPQKNDVCVEVVLDQCEYRRPPADMSIDRVLRAAPEDWSTFAFLAKKNIAEREFKRKKSGKGITDGDMVVTYVRLGALIHGLAEEFRKPGESLPMRPIGGKAALGLEALEDKFPGLVPREVLQAWKLVA